MGFGVGKGWVVAAMGYCVCPRLSFARCRGSIGYLGWADTRDQDAASYEEEDWNLWLSWDVDVSSYAVGVRRLMIHGFGFHSHCRDSFFSFSSRAPRVHWYRSVFSLC